MKQLLILFACSALLLVTDVRAQGALVPQVATGAAKPSEQTNSRVVDDRTTPIAHTGALNATEFGMDASGSEDTTAAFLKALTASISIPNASLPLGICHPIYFPTGSYQIHETGESKWGSCFMLEGSYHIGGSRLYYGGAGGPGSYLLQFGGLSNGGFQNLYFSGVNPGNKTGVTAMAQNAIITGALDSGAMLQDFQIADFYGNGLSITNKSTNAYIHHFRTDGVGGYSVSLVANDRADGSPVHLYDYTTDNALHINMAKYAIAHGYVAGSGSKPSSNGQGDFYCLHCHGEMIEAADVRDEENVPTKNIGNADQGRFFFDDDSAVSASTFVGHNIAVSGAANGPHSFLSTATGHVSMLLFGNQSFEAMSGIYKNRSTQQEYGDQFQANGAFWSFGRSAYQFQGYCLEGQCFDVIPKIDLLRNADPRQIGDWFFVHQTDFVPGTMGPMNVVVSPSSGRASLEAAQSISETGKLTANPNGGANISGFNPLYDDGRPHLSMHLGDNITIPKGGGGGNGNALATIACIDAVGSGTECPGLAEQGVVVKPAPGCLTSGPCPAAGAVAINWTQLTTSNFGLEANRVVELPAIGSPCPYVGDYEWLEIPVAGLPLGVACGASGWIDMPSYPGASQRADTCVGRASSASEHIALQSGTQEPTKDTNDIVGGKIRGPFQGLVEEMGISSNAAFSGIGDELTQTASASVAISTATSSQPLMLMSTSTATSGDSSGWLGQQIYYAGRQPSVTFGVAYQSSADYSSDTRIWLGLFENTCDAATVTASDTPACNFVAIRHSAMAGDTSYQCVTGNGKLTTSIPIKVAPATAFTRMNINIGPSSVTCTVDSTGVSITATLPASTTILRDLFLNVTSSSTSAHLRLNGVYGVSQNGTY